MQPRHDIQKHRCQKRTSDERVKERVYWSLPFFHSTGKHAKKRKTPEKDPVTHANMETTHADCKQNRNKAMLERRRDALRCLSHES